MYLLANDLFDDISYYLCLIFDAESNLQYYMYPFYPLYLHY